MFLVFDYFCLFPLGNINPILTFHKGIKKGGVGTIAVDFIPISDFFLQNERVFSLLKMERSICSFSFSLIDTSALAA